MFINVGRPPLRRHDAGRTVRKRPPDDPLERRGRPGVRAVLSRRGGRLLASGHGGRLDIFVEFRCRHPREVPADRIPVSHSGTTPGTVEEVTLYRAPTTADADAVAD